MWLLATILDRAVLQGELDAKKALCWENILLSNYVSGHGVFSLVRRNGNKKQTMYKDPLHILIKEETHLSSKLLPNWQSRRDTSNKGVGPEKKGRPVRTLGPPLLGQTAEGQDSPLAPLLLAWGAGTA